MLKSSAVRFTDCDSIVTIDPTDESVGYFHSSAPRTFVLCDQRWSKHSFPNDYLAGILT